MSTDKRTVATDALETLGTLIDETAGRDAIHLAVEPIVAVEILHPGQHVGIENGKATGRAIKTLGIVDPFLDKPVMPGERFWLIVYPRQITSLRHVWEHPAFPAEATAVNRASVEASEAWLREFLDNADCPGYEPVMGALKLILNGQQVAPLPGWDLPAFELDEHSFLFRGMDGHGEIPPVFWIHVEIVLGIPVPAEMRASWFSCSC